MQVEKSLRILQESIQLESAALDRTVSVDFYLPAFFGQPPSSASSMDSLQSSMDSWAGSGELPFPPAEMGLLLINDGQELGRLGLADILEDLYSRDLLTTPLLCVGIHAGTERIMEYGTAATADFQGRGARAAAYTRFVLNELIPFIRHKFQVPAFKEKAFAGFSLGALSAMDIGWNHAQEFSKLGLFSGSFWWRTRDKEDPDYNEHTDRIMERQVREGGYYPWLKFFFECGTEDEQEDRNHNGIIDSIDDTQDLIRELIAKGYDPATAIHYREIEGGRHEVTTWARAMPEFLLWGWGK
ncbi:MAG TPA: alpha/beta hydrolase-fold protein [Puia sp.]|nr:alpha/beta hydrolase-fold protein [Puia sp.]